MPVAKQENGYWPHPARLPLGVGWAGHCTAPGHEGETPAQDVLQEFCNLGYPTNCSWSPAERRWDAVRFGVSARSGRNQAQDSPDGSSRVLLLRYVCERNHRPIEYGELEFDLTRAIWLQGHEDSRIQKMAECFLVTYLKKKS
jgi:hypothetical protein